MPGNNYNIKIWFKKTEQKNINVFFCSVFLKNETQNLVK